MAWKITKTYLPGESSVKSRGFDKVADKAIHKFRLYDDDGGVYFEGISTNDSSFAPLDLYGMPNYGCTEIRYWGKHFRSGETGWQQL